MRVRHCLNIDSNEITIKDLLEALVEYNIPAEAVLKYDHYDEFCLLIEWGN